MSVENSCSRFCKFAAAWSVLKFSEWKIKIMQIGIKSSINAEKIRQERVVIVYLRLVSRLWDKILSKAALATHEKSKISKRAVSWHLSRLNTSF